MQFDHSFVHSLPPTLPAAVVETPRRVIAERRAAGLSVQFLREDGRRDEWQFNTLAQRDAFVRRLAGAAYAISGGDHV
ncbi:MAG: hypothetical protein ACR652_10920 [Methylocystis sp.]|uniref:hypothetical protein n=1 Tax=Methylocystis sp. TaxID=1911079 RepID=UPI003DA406D3